MSDPAFDKAWSVLIDSAISEAPRPVDKDVARAIGLVVKRIVDDIHRIADAAERHAKARKL